MLLIRTVFCSLAFLISIKGNLSAQKRIDVKKGKLVYNAYANQGESNAINTIPDFSFAGYKKGGVSLPDVPVKITVQAKSGDCTSLIQEAINKAASLPLDQNGFRGAILLKKGIYRVDSSLWIKASGVVLRGEGNEADGTVLVSTKKSKNDFIIIKGNGNGYGEIKDSRKRIVNKYLPTGTKTFEVEAGHHFSMGDAIVIQKIPNEQWVKELEMGQYGWKAEDYKMDYERTITAIKSNSITIDIPVVDPIEEQYGYGEVFKSNIKGRISTCGIENLRLESTFVSDEDENHGWTAIVLSRAIDCWVKDVVVKYFGYSCVSISDMSAFNTVQDCAMIDPKSITTGSRKYSFNIDHNSMGNLVQRCASWGGRHDYVTGARVPGPNVFLDCFAENTFADIGPHHRWATGILFDNIYGGQIRVQNRKAMGSGHGWAGVQILFWNCQSAKSDIKVESPKGAMNWGIGNVGEIQNGDGYWESWGAHVEPRNLYLKQFGGTPGK